MPAYSIGKQEKKPSFVRQSIVPGAGSYNTSLQHSSRSKKSPGCIIGKQTRLKTEKIYGPSPISYDTSRQSIFADKKRGYHISGRLRQRVQSEGPGPTSYCVPNIKQSKYYSFGIRTKKMNFSQDLPGPGTYQINKVRYAQAISFQQSKRPSPEDVQKKYIPGPGKYNSSQKQQRYKFTFPKRQKFFQQSKVQKQKKIIPGPGAYSNININNIKKQILAVRFGRTKRQFNQNNQYIPGPGTYSPDSSVNKKRSQVAVIGKSPKDIFGKNSNPGPAAYHIENLQLVKSKQPSIIFGKTQRALNNRRKEVSKIGPGSYNIDYHNRGCAYSISGRNSQEIIQSQTPGPLSYSPKYQTQFRKTQMGKIGTDRKFFNSKQVMPGPGTYNVEDSSKNLKTFHFTKQIRKQNINNNPGPGTYKIKALIGSEVNKKLDD